MNGVCLFSGYGGISKALERYVRAIAYCEINEFSQYVLLSRMDDGSLKFAPVWNDITTMDGKQFKGLVNIVYGGFPCQDISLAGTGKGLDGKRSGLFFEVVRFCKEASPQFIFLENVPTIRTRGAIEVQEALSSIGYACRWVTLSASDVGANHKRERWFLLARKVMAHTDSVREQSKHDKKRKETCGINDSSKIVSDTESVGIQRLWASGEQVAQSHDEKKVSLRDCEIFSNAWWNTEPDVGRVVNGASFRMDRIKSEDDCFVDKKSGEKKELSEVMKLLRTDRIKALGNGVVPFQVRVAFEYLMGIRK